MRAGTKIGGLLKLPQELLEIGMDLFNYVTDSVWSLNGSLASPKVMARYLVVASDESACSLNRPSWGEQKLRGLNVRGPTDSGCIGRPFCHGGTVPESIKGPNSESLGLQSVVIWGKEFRFSVSAYLTNYPFQG